MRRICSLLTMSLTAAMPSASAAQSFEVVSVRLEEMRPMLQNSLRARVHLVVHSEHRVVQGYELVWQKAA